MATITISDLHPTVEYAELSDLELESVVGGGKWSATVGAKQTNKGPKVTGEVSYGSGWYKVAAKGSYAKNGSYEGGVGLTLKW